MKRPTQTCPNMQQNLELGMLCASLGIRTIQRSYLCPSTAAATMYAPLVLTTWSVVCVNTIVVYLEQANQASRTASSQGTFSKSDSLTMFKYISYSRPAACFRGTSFHILHLYDLAWQFEKILDLHCGLRFSASLYRTELFWDNRYGDFITGLAPRHAFPSAKRHISTFRYFTRENGWGLLVWTVYAKTG
jgi:hypothetical protein